MGKGQRRSGAVGVQVGGQGRRCSGSESALGFGSGGGVEVGVSCNRLGKLTQNCN